MQTSLFKLSNGLRVLHLQDPGAGVAHMALMNACGTREEAKGQEGLAHFMEHCLFKGTRKRKAYHILNRLETIGGELNAFTTKEETCLHASLMARELERGVELLADILFESVFPEAEVEKEREVIADEIKGYADTPYEQIYDDFESQLYRGNALGHPILGLADTVRSFTREDLLLFKEKNYRLDQMVFTLSSSHHPTAVEQVLNKYFNRLGMSGKRPRRKPPVLAPAVNNAYNRSVSQAHYICGLPSLPALHPDRYAMVLMNNILGGPGMNSRLNLNIREKYGYTYTIESGYTGYTDTGVFHCYFATDPTSLPKVLKLLHREFDRMCSDTISSMKMRQYQDQLIGQITLTRENRLSLVLSMSKALLWTGKIVTPEEIYARIREVSPQAVRRVAEMHLSDPGRISSLQYLPQN